MNQPGTAIELKVEPAPVGEPPGRGVELAVLVDGDGLVVHSSE